MFNYSRKKYKQERVQQQKKQSFEETKWWISDQEHGEMIQ